MSAGEEIVYGLANRVAHRLGRRGTMLEVGGDPLAAAASALRDVLAFLGPAGDAAADEAVAAIEAARRGVSVRAMLTAARVMPFAPLGCAK